VLEDPPSATADNQPGLPSRPQPARYEP
jgi:hypothetical protein